MASRNYSTANSSPWLLGISTAVTGGQLFEYNSGAWAPASRCLTSVNLEFVLQALRRDQAYYSIMAQMKPKRCYDDIVFEIKAIQQVGMEEVLLQWQLQDIIPRKPEVRAREWLCGLSELCRTLRHQFAEHSRTSRLNNSSTPRKH